MGHFRTARFSSGNYQTRRPRFQVGSFQRLTGSRWDLNEHGMPMSILENSFSQQAECREIAPESARRRADTLNATHIQRRLGLTFR